MFLISSAVLRHLPDAKETTQRLHPPARQSASCEISPSTGEKWDSVPSVWASLKPDPPHSHFFPSHVYMVLGFCNTPGKYTIK